MGTIFQTSLYAADRAAFELTNTAQCTATLLLGSTTKDLHLPCSLRAFLTLYSCSISRFTTLCAQYEKRSDHSLPRFMGKRHNHKRSRARPRHREEETRGVVDTSSASATRCPGWQAVIQENAPTHHCSKPAPAVKPSHMGTNGLPTLTSIPLLKVRYCVSGEQWTVFGYELRERDATSLARSAGAVCVLSEQSQRTAMATDALEHVHSAALPCLHTKSTLMTSSWMI